ncbi:MAG TPA: hypothetical protein VMW52_10580 [Phycisphaerae bacterium]|nr:hypothetical protein [Phycisphaerae bacterium]
MSFEQTADQIIVNAWATITWDVKDLGYTGKPTVKVTPEYIDKTTAQTGKVVLGANFVGATADLVFPLYKTDLEMLRAVMPGYVEGEAFYLLPTALGGDLYDRAKLLTLHPLAAGESTETDINILKAAPIGALELARDGQGHDVLPVVFRFFPDRSQLPKLVWGYIGDVPA